jgi:SAM-dependent methyltransferase
MPENLLKRIISASSNPGDLILDPFCGSGATPAAALQLSRRYAGIEISREYVEKAKKRLIELNRPSLIAHSTSHKRQVTNNELNEIKRLSVDMGKPLREIAADKNLLKIFANQFAVRMNNKKKYSETEIVTAVIDSAKSEP